MGEARPDRAVPGWPRERRSQHEERKRSPAGQESLNDALRRGESPQPVGALMEDVTAARTTRPPTHNAEKTYLHRSRRPPRGDAPRRPRFVFAQDAVSTAAPSKVTTRLPEEFGPWRLIDAPSPRPRCRRVYRRGVRACARSRDSVRRLVSCAWTISVTSRQTALPRWHAGCRSSSASHRVEASSSGRSTRRIRELVAHLPGLKCFCPATPEDRKGLLVRRSRTHPVSLFEHSTSTADQARCRRALRTPIRKARTHRRVTTLRDHLGGDGLHRHGHRSNRENDISVELTASARDAMDKSGGWRGPKNSSCWCCTRTTGRRFGGEIAATLADSVRDRTARGRLQRGCPVTFHVLEKAFSRSGTRNGLRSLAEYRKNGHGNSVEVVSAHNGLLRLGGDDHMG